MNKRIFFSDNSTLIDFSTALDDYRPSNTKVIPFVATEDKIFIGSRLPFNHLFVKLKSKNTLPSNMDVEYWDGNAWVSVVELSDQTLGFTQDGFVYFTPDRQNPWKLSNTNYSSEIVSGLQTVCVYDMYWLRIGFSADLDLTTELQYIGNKFSDDYDLQGEFPDLGKTSVMNAFKAGTTSFEEQHIIATNRVIEDLINKGIIDDGAQILRGEDYKSACVMKVAEIIFNSFGDDYKDDKLSARKEYETRLGNKRIHVIDQNKNGGEDVLERTHTTGWFSR
jgi:hypothetical protein